jgi:hypothetical protein
MSSSWERFELLCKSGPDLSLQDHILLQHFYIGLNKESRAYLNTSSHGSFIHLTSNGARMYFKKPHELPINDTMRDGMLYRITRSDP